MTEVGRRCERGLVRGSRRSTPHLTSPLKGGRDELGKGEVGWVLASEGVAEVGICE